jgi:hypothetical protein
MHDTIGANRKEDALELAYLIYDIFKENEDKDGKIESGQNNAQQTQDS